MANKVMKLNELALGYAAAILSAACMLLLGIGWNIGVYSTAAVAMSNWHMFFGPSVLGIIAGMVEGAIWAFIMAYVFAYLYNKWA